MFLQEHFVESFKGKSFQYKHSLLLSYINWSVTKIVIKVIEVIGSSDKSWEDAAKNAVETAAKTVKNIIGVDVVNFTAHVEGGKITTYKATCKLAFKVKE
jgi:flavin-binding protein dodecin